MLSLRRDVYDDYTWDTFQAIVRRTADIVAVQETHGGHRRLCQVRSQFRPPIAQHAQASGTGIGQPSIAIA